jgi:RNA polymerase sigma-70 factor (ECF subfamily)
MLVVAEHEQLPVPQARAGEPGAWDALFKRYQLPLFTYVFEWVHDEQTSLDIVQETFINAALHIDGLREDVRFGSWLFGIAHQRCIQWWRKERRGFALEPLADDEMSDGEDPSEWLIRQEQEDAFMNGVNQLPPPQRSVLLLHFIEEFSLEEIADITGAQLGTVKSRLYYAKKALREWLEKNNL